MSDVKDDDYVALNPKQDSMLISLWSIQKLTYIVREFRGFMCLWTP